MLLAWARDDQDSKACGSRHVGHPRGCPRCVMFRTPRAAPGWRSGMPSHRRRRTGSPPAGRHRRDDRPARHRAATVHLSCGPGSPTSPSPTWTARCTTSAPWSSSSRCAAPCSCSRATCCRRPGAARRPGWPRSERARLAKDVEPAGLADDGEPGSTPRAAASSPARGRRRADRASSCASRCPSSPAGRPVARASGTAARPDRAAGAHPARRRGEIVRGRNAGHWRTSRPRWTRWRTGWASVPSRSTQPRGTPSWSAAGCGPSAPAPRPTSSVVARLDHDRRPRGAGRRRRGRGRPSTAAGPAGCCPTTSSRSRPGRALGGAAAGARPDRDGLEGARLLPRPARAAALRHATATPAPPPGGTAGSSAAGSRTRTASCGSRLLEDVGADAPGGARRRGRAADRLAGRASGSARSTRRLR